MQRVLTTSEIAAAVGGSLHGPGDTEIRSINTVAEARPDEITFIAKAAYVPQWRNSQAAAALVSSSVAAVFAERSDDPRPWIIVADAELASIKLLELFQPPEPLPEPGAHPTAVIHPSAKLGAEVRVGPHVTVDQHSVVGDGVVLSAGVRIEADVQIGAGSFLHANVVVRHGCRIGRNVVLHAGVVIGTDGFGYRPHPTEHRLVKVPHIGNVIIEDDIEIGANTCIDRGKFGSTIIGAGTKIDNLCQIAHNCRIGRCCVIAAQTGIAGSTVVGDWVQMGGQVGIIEHLHIGNRARLGARAGVLKDVPAGETWLGYPAHPAEAVLRQWACIRKLPDLVRRTPPRASSGG